VAKKASDSAGCGDRADEKVLATVSMVALTSVARAADMPSKERIYSPIPMATWNGLYAGVQGGIASNKTSFSDGSFINNDFVTHLDEQKAGGAVGGLLFTERPLRLWH
jgi:opacity protein-like surface antigen